MQERLFIYQDSPGDSAPWCIGCKMNPDAGKGYYDIKIYHESLPDDFDIDTVLFRNSKDVKANALMICSCIVNLGLQLDKLNEENIKRELHHLI